MWPVVSSYLLQLAAVFSAGWAIRLMDDAQDVEVDRLVGRGNLAAQFEEGTTAYALCALSLGVVCSPALALCLFGAAYAVGMAGDWTILPTRLPAAVEGVLIWALSLWRFGWRPAVAALLIMLALQLLDDWMDKSIDAVAKTRNWARLLGDVGTWLLLGACGVGATFCEPWLLTSSVIAFAYFQYRELVVKAA